MGGLPAAEGRDQDDAGAQEGRAVYFPLKYAFAIVALALSAAFIAPLIVFSMHLYNNPDAIMLSLTDFRYDPGTNTVSFKVVLNYNLSMELKDLIVEIAGQEVYFGDVTAGTYERVVNFTVSDISEALSRPNIKVRFTLLGLYPIEIEVLGERR